MPAGKGIHLRDWEGTMGGSAVVFTEFSISVSNGQTDVSVNTSGEWRVAHALPGQKTVTISVSGVTQDNSLLKSSLQEGSQMYTCEFECDADNAGTSGSKVSGDFNFTSMEDSGSVGEVMNFSGTLESSGAIVFTDPVA